MKKRKYFQKLVILIAIIIGIGFLIPQNLKMPVDNATSADYHPDSFWYFPWGKSVTHKGIDIFASTGTNVTAGVPGIVLYAGEVGLGGKVVLLLGPKWRLHYFAHLDEVNTKRFSLVGSNSSIGTVGSTGNAVGKPPHLHYSIATIVPYPWRIDDAPQGWKKMFYLNPIDFLEKTS